MAENDKLPICDYCGQPCDSSTECNALTCTYANCEESVYHQECLYAFFKANKLDRARKTGYKCPRGCGKGTSYTSPCPGRIDKSHPIIPRNEKKVKRAQAAVEHPLPPRPNKQERQADAAAAKQKAEEERARAKEETARAKQNGPTVPIDKPVPARVLASAMNAGHNTKLDKQEKLRQEQERQAQLRAEAARVKEEINKGKAGPSTAAVTITRQPSNPGIAASNAGWQGGISRGGSGQLQEDVLPAPAVQQFSLLDLVTKTAKKARGSSNAAAAAVIAASEKPTVLPYLTPAVTAASPAGAIQSPSQPSELEIQSHQHFPPVTAATNAPPPDTVSKQLWPPLPTPAAQASPMVTPRQQCQSDAGVATMTPAAASRQLTPDVTPDMSRQTSMSLGGAHPSAQAAAAAMDVAAMSETGGEDEDASEAANGSANKLTKAQRKNLKRLERKKRQGVLLADSDVNSISDATSMVEGETGPAMAEHRLARNTHQQQLQQQPTQLLSPRQQLHQAEPPQLTPRQLQQHCEPSVSSNSSPAAASSHAAQQPVKDTFLEDLCVEALVDRKCKGVFEQLRKLGFSGWQAAAGIRAAGCQLGTAITWLCENRSKTAQQLTVQAAAMPLPVVEIDYELNQLAEGVQRLVGVITPESVHHAVFISSGDVPKALALLKQQYAARQPVSLLHSPSLETFVTANSQWDISRAQTAQSELPWVGDELQQYNSTDFLNMLRHQDSYASLSGTLYAGSVQPSPSGNMWAGSRASFAHGDQPREDSALANGHLQPNGIQRGEASSMSGTYSRPGLNGSVGTWESIGSADNNQRAIGVAAVRFQSQGATDAEINSLVELMTAS